MTILEGQERLDHALSRDPAGRYMFTCKKAFVMVKLRGRPGRLKFCAKDKYVFRLEGECLTVEKRDGGVVLGKYYWEQIECLAAGEPETDHGTLFQG